MNLDRMIYVAVCVYFNEVSGLSNIAFIAVLFLGLIIFEIYLMRINYKGCFKYKLREGSKLWSYVDRKVGILRLFISPLFDFLIISLVASVFLVIFGISLETAFISAMSGMLIFILSDSIYDKESVEAFEKSIA